MMEGREAGGIGLLGRLTRLRGEKGGLFPFAGLCELVGRKEVSGFEEDSEN